MIISHILSHGNNLQPPDSELKILSDTPRPVEKFEDIDKEHKNLKDELAKEKKIFFEKVPSKIDEEVQKLEKMRKAEIITEQEFNEKLRCLEERKNKGGFTGFSASFKAYFVKNYSKRRAINKIKNLQELQQSHVKEWKEHPEDIFIKEQVKTINEIKEFDEIKEDPFYAGAKGEIDVLKKLSQLNDNYHVFCGLYIQLPHYVTYKGRKNLGSALRWTLLQLQREELFLLKLKTGV